MCLVPESLHHQNKETGTLDGPDKIDQAACLGRILWTCHSSYKEKLSLPWLVLKLVSPFSKRDNLQTLEVTTFRIGSTFKGENLLSKEANSFLLS